MKDELLDYLDNEMSPAEKEAFEKRLQAEPELAKELEQLRLAKDAVRLYGTHEEVAGVHQEFMNAQPLQQATPAPVIKMRRPLRSIMVAAASVILIVLAIGGLYFYQLSPAKVYGDTYVDYVISGSRGEGGELPAIEKAYAEKRYADVIAQSHDTSLTSKEKFLVGLSYLQTTVPDSAAAAFRNILSSSDTTYHPDAEFYLSLSYLKGKNYNDALALMRKIKGDESHVYHRYITASTIRETELLKWK